MLLGIDIGGTSVKFGLVSESGELLQRKKFDTREFVNNGFEKSIGDIIGEFIQDNPGLKGAGLGFPGLVSADRKQAMLLPNIPEIIGLPIVDYLQNRFPIHKFRIENDAKCAALGECYFGKNEELDNFLLVTLGTGVGGGAVINRQLFLGGRGNAMEIGHILLDNGKTLEQHIGLSHILNYSTSHVEAAGRDSLLKQKELTMYSLCEAADSGDESALEIFAYVGKKLGEGLVSVIRVLDVDKIVVGGGVSYGFPHMLKEMQASLNAYLPAYYTKDLKIYRATLGNEAGLLGAASLIIND